MKPRVVIVGGGFGGAYTLRRLVRHCSVTLINPTEHFLFTPLLHEYLAGTVSICSVMFPYSTVVHPQKYTFVQGRATHIDLQSKRVYANEIWYPYDYLVLAIGSRSNYKIIKGSETYSSGLKSIADADNFLHELRTLLTSRKESVIVSIIGGGPTGIELATELARHHPLAEENHTYYTINLIHSGETFLPEQSDYFSQEVERVLRKLNVHVHYHSRVSEVTKQAIILHDGSVLHSDLTLFTAGVIPHTVQTEPSVTLDKGFFVVNEFLQLPDFPDVFALGDCAAFSHNNHYAPQLAQVAVAQAPIVAKNMRRLIKGKSLKPYHFHLQGFLVSLGQKRAVAQISRVKFRGFPAWFIWRTVYLIKLPGLGNKLRVMWDWTKGLLRN